MRSVPRFQNDWKHEIAGADVGRVWLWLLVALAFFGLLASPWLLSYAANYGVFWDAGRFHHGRKNLKLLIQAEDRYYQKTGEYLPLDPFSDDSDVKK